MARCGGDARRPADGLRPSRVSRAGSAQRCGEVGGVDGCNRDVGRLRYAEAVEQAALAVLAKRKPNRSLQTNLEFYTALLLEALGVPRDAFTGVFAVARVVGWIAHALEQQAGGRLIRPQSDYVGPLPDDVSERGLIGPRRRRIPRRCPCRCSPAAAPRPPR